MLVGNREDSMFREIAKETLFPFSMILLAIIPLFAVVLGVVFLGLYLADTFNGVVVFTVMGLLCIPLMFIFIVLMEYIPKKYEEWKVKSGR